jgi:hypothetical protein
MKGKVLAETEWLEDLHSHYLEEEKTYRGWGKVGRADQYKALAERVRQALHPTTTVRDVEAGSGEEGNE